ncbi:type IV pilus twitching motility protein PilT [Telmatospirillum sp. J64-1]|uniref:type IV pilus twitching motility protein PilT n=1 Tax=Telmatospirillum sp. J64-1 TaxID=2502183 RepID=UPI00115E61EE|nr:type IV pilus twitching motility protein PilT [Telmatospirillum sp. J64-1]
MEITELLAFTQQHGASDLHLMSLREPMLRLSGELRPVKTGPLSPDMVKTMLYSIMTEEQRAEFERDLESDFAISFGDSARFRVNAFTTITGAGAVFRTIPTVVPSLEKLGAPEIFKKFAALEKGLVLVTGPTGSGKSTTLAAMINHINETQNKHILTIEDPVEFVHESKCSLINHREVGRHTKSFARALKSALREDPDVILVGEMRDHETISLALTAAETGHLVMGTLHTSSAAKTVDRIIDVFPGSDKDMVRTMLAGSLQAVISQTLLKKTGGGRVAAHDILVGTDAVRNLIRENKIPQVFSMMQVGQRYGMQTMQDAVRKLVEQGLVAPEEMERFAPAGGGDTPPSPQQAVPRPQPTPAPSPALPPAPRPEPPREMAMAGAEDGAKPRKGLRSFF